MGIFHVFKIVQMVPNRLKHLIYDFMNNGKCDPHDFITDDELKRSCWTARSKYQDHCEKKKKLEMSNKSDHKLEAILNNIVTVNRLKQKNNRVVGEGCLSLIWQSWNSWIVPKCNWRLSKEEISEKQLQRNVKK